MPVHPYKTYRILETIFLHAPNNHKVYDSKGNGIHPGPLTLDEAKLLIDGLVTSKELLNKPDKAIVYVPQPELPTEDEIQ